MTALKGRVIDAFVDRPDIKTGVVLVYGPDAGKVSETADKLAAHFLGASPHPMNLVNLHFTKIEADPGRLIAEANSGSLFASGPRVVIVRGATNALAPTLEALAEGAASIVIVEAGPLSPSDALRKVAEKSSLARALPCYADDERWLGELIRTTFANAGIQIDADAARTLREILGNDRAVSRSELDKLTLYALDTKRLSDADVLALCGDNAALTFEEIADSVGAGHGQNFDDAFSRALAAGTDVSAILSAVLSHFAALRTMRAEFDAGGAAGEVAKLNRVHFSRARAVESQIRSWSDASLARGAARLYEAIAMTRKQPELDVAIARQTLLSLTVAAARM
ncbi:MAG: DNA polymerase III subunit delta [Cucumibacter sp.]